MADTGDKPVDENATYNITLAEDGTVTYQGEDTAAAFTAEEDVYVDDTSKDFDSGDGTKENPFLIMNARQLDNVRKYMGSSTRGDFYYFEIGRNIDLTGYYGETWAEQGWTEDRGWMPIGWTPDSNTNCDEFWGNLDGQGYTITGLTIHNPTNVQTGLFGWVKGQTGHEDAGVIRNLKVEEPDVWGRMERGHTYDGKVGVIAGQTNYGATIENCNVIGGSVRGGLEEEPTQSVGGILGYQGSASDRIINCTVEDLDVSVSVLASEAENDPDAYAKRLLLGRRLSSTTWETVCSGSKGSGRVNGTEMTISFES